MIVVGYARESSARAFDESKQPGQIRRFCQEKGYNLVFLEHEVGTGKNVCRPGLWRVTRSLVCYRCDPGFMPTSFDVDAWVRRALMFCRCSDPAGVAGIVVADMQSLCCDPTSGSKYALALAVVRKHLFVGERKSCVSCCNPAAAPFMGRS